MVSLPNNSFSVRIFQMIILTVTSVIHYHVLALQLQLHSHDHYLMNAFYQWFPANKMSIIPLDQLYHTMVIPVFCPKSCFLVPFLIQQQGRDQAGFFQISWSCLFFGLLKMLWFWNTSYIHRHVSLLVSYWGVYQLIQQLWNLISIRWEGWLTGTHVWLVLYQLQRPCINL